MAAAHYVNAAAIGIPPADYLALDAATREAVIDEHNRRVEG